MTVAAETFGPVASYLPHRAPMLLIDEIIHVTGDVVECRTTIQPDCVFAIDGHVHVTAMIEFVAQVVAIAVGVRAWRKGEPPRTGVIMGCREITFARQHFAVGDKLTIAATKVYGEDLVAAFTSTVSCQGEVCATVQISVVDADALQAANLGAPV